MAFTMPKPKPKKPCLSNLSKMNNHLLVLNERFFTPIRLTLQEDRHRADSSIRSLVFN
jgi:hypothetical protein